jgi:hypothetical protein
MNPSSVRRNLFHGNLSRRPASAGPPNGVIPPNPNGVSNRPSHRLKPTSSDSGPPARPFKTVENKDIVVRDKNGGYKLDIPTLPPALVEDADELAELDEERAFGAAELTGIDKESMFIYDSIGVFEARDADTWTGFEAALVEMMIRHRNRQANDEPDGAFHSLNPALILLTRSRDSQDRARKSTQESGIIG